MADQGGRIGTRGGVSEQELNVSRPHLAAIDPIGRARTPVDAANHLDGLVIVELGRSGTVTVVDGKGHFGMVARHPCARASKDHLIHAARAHSLGRIGPHDPA